MAVGTYEITHERIMESGRTLFLKNGYERTNLRELCKGAGITTGAFYRHFEDKEALFAALVDRPSKDCRRYMMQQVINALTSYLWRISIKFGLYRLTQWLNLSDISLNILMRSN